MKTSMSRPVCFAACFLLLSVPFVAQTSHPPKIAHAQVSIREGNLQREIASAQTPTWIGYEIATTHPMHSDWNDNALYLEGNRGDGVQENKDAANITMSPAMLLLRIASGKVTKVHIDGMDRDVDGGGLPFVWLTGVSPAESISVLKSIVEANAVAATKIAGARDGDSEARETERDARRLQDASILAIALQSVPEGTAVLRSFTAANYPPDLRERAAFWLANERGSDGFKAIAELLHAEHDEALREKLVFDLTLVKGESKKAAIDVLLATAKSDASPEIRSKAQFWLAEVASKKAEKGTTTDPRILATLGDAAKDDPNASIRKSAVFALSRLPDGQGVPKLIQLASTTTDATTRHEAIFWLGRSKDPQALAYLEKLVQE